MARRDCGKMMSGQMSGHVFLSIFYGRDLSRGKKIKRP